MSPSEQFPWSELPAVAITLHIGVLLVHMRSTQDLYVDVEPLQLAELGRV